MNFLQFGKRPKDGSRSDPNNYRPISVLPVLSKILERLAHNRLYRFITANDMLTPSQSGFRKGNSTSTCLVDFLQNIYENIEQSRTVGVLFLDLRKAFDTVDHRILVSKLSHLGLSNSTLYWLESYLYGRTQVTSVNNCYSKPGIVECGVPQGSILGPLLFILYVNSLPSVLQESSVYLYADDTAIAVSGNNSDDIVNNLKDELTKANNWLCEHKLSLNLSKTKLMFFV